MADSRIHLPTLMGISAVAVFIDVISHEAVGHGGVCLALGGAFRQVSSVHLDCEADALSDWSSRAISAGGTLDNLIIAALAFLALRALAPSRPGTLRAFLWCTLAINGFSGAGYLMTSPLFGFGDWTAFLENLSPHWPWAIGLSLCGLAGSWLVLRLTASTARPFWSNGPDGKSRAWKLAAVPYATGVVLNAAGGALNPRGLFLMAVMASAFGCCWLLFVPTFFKPGTGSPEPLGVEKSLGWMIAGAIAALTFVFVFGPGLPRG